MPKHRWTPLARLFVREYMIDLNGTQAYVRAGGSPRGANVNSSVLMRKPHVRARVDELLAERERVLKDKAVRVLEETYLQAVVDPGEMYDENGALLPVHQMPAHVRRAIAVEVETRSDGLVITKAKLHDKRASQELFAKYAGKLKERVELGGPNGEPISVVFNLAPAKP